MVGSWDGPATLNGEDRCGGSEGSRREISRFAAADNWTRYLSGYARPRGVRHRRSALVLSTGDRPIITVLKIMLFGAWIEVTQYPVTIYDTPIEIEAEEVLDVVTTGAHVRIDVSHLLKEVDARSIKETAQRPWPEGCIVASAFSSEVGPIRFDDWGVSRSKNKIHLQLFSATALGTEMEFHKLAVSACPPLLGVRVYWANYYM